MVPPPFSYIWRSAARVTRKAPSRCTLMTLLQSENASLCTGSMCWMPALANAISRPPHFSTMAATPSSTACSFVTSIARAMAVPPAFSMASTASWALSRVKSATATLAPSRPYCSAIARPMPRPAPVIRAIRFSRRIVIFSLVVSHTRQPGRDFRNHEHNGQSYQLDNDERNNATVNIGNSDLRRRHTLDVEQRESNRRCQERCLQAHGKQNGEPHQIKTKLLHYGRHQGQDDQSDLHPIQEEPQQEDTKQDGENHAIGSERQTQQGIFDHLVATQAAQYD